MEDFVILPKENQSKNEQTILEAIQCGYTNLLLKPGKWTISGTINVPNGITIELMFDGDIAFIEPQQDSKVIFKGNSCILLQPTTLNTYKILHLVNDNVHIDGLNIIGDRDKNTNNNGEHGFGILVEGAKNIQISNCKISNCFGDGIYLIDFNELKISNTVVDNNRRNGISLIRGENAEIINCIFSNTNGTLPEAGIDIEPNPDKNGELVGVLNNIIIKDCFSNNNAVAGYNLSAGTKDKGSIKFINCKSFNDGYGFYIYAFKAKQVSLEIENCTTYNSTYSGYFHTKSNLKTSIKEISIHRPCNTYRGEQYNRSGFSIKNSENISAENVKVLNLRDEDFFYGCSLENTKNINVNSIVFDDNHYKWLFRRNLSLDSKISFSGKNFSPSSNMDSREIGSNIDDKREDKTLMGQIITNECVNNKLRLDFSDNIQSNFKLHDTYNILVVKNQRIEVLGPKTPNGNQSPDFHYWADKEGSELQIQLNKDYQWEIIKKTGNF